MSHSEFEKLIEQNNEHLSKLNEIVQQAVQEEEFIASKLLKTGNENLTLLEKISDKIAKFGGSWRFILGFGILVAIWILINTISPYKFDPYPFSSLKFLLSGLAALQVPFVMMNQNRKAEEDRIRTDNEYMINLKAELEIRTLHQKINIMMQDQSKTILESQAMQVKYLNEVSEQSSKRSEEQTKAIHELKSRLEEIAIAMKK